MTDEQFAAGVDAILAEHSTGHTAHRELDMLWTHYTQELPEGHPVRVATAKWMQAIEGEHDPAKPYPLNFRAVAILTDALTEARPYVAEATHIAVSAHEALASIDAALKLIRGAA